MAGRTNPRLGRRMGASSSSNAKNRQFSVFQPREIENRLLLDTPCAKGRFQFSPDGHWLAYMSAESGVPEIYVTSFPAITRTRQISTSGGCTPVGRKDGKELLYYGGAGRGDVSGCVK